MATLTGPITGGDRGWPFGAAAFDLAALGYIEEEYFFEGDAVRYRHPQGTGRSFDGKWSAEIAGSAPFKSRMLIRRPADPAKFNGTVVSLWNNVSRGFDIFVGESPEIYRGGFAIALASDVRIATPTLKMNAAFIRIGLSACDIGVSYFLPRMVGSSVAAELMLTGRFLRAQRALALGLVSAVVDPEALEAEGEALAAEMLATTPLGLRLTKECLNHSIDAGGLEAAIAMEDRNQILCAQGEDFREGVAAFLEKRPPVYARR